MNYSEKLKDPRWQKKRLEVLSRDDFKCTLCGDDKTTLHVHHEQYSENPWDTDISFLYTHCEFCHGVVEFCKRMNPDVRIASIIKLQANGFNGVWFFAKTDKQSVIVFEYDKNLEKFNALLAIKKDDVSRIIQFLNTNNV